MSQLIVFLMYLKLAMWTDGNESMRGLWCMRGDYVIIVECVGSGPLLFVVM